MLPKPRNSQTVYSNERRKDTHSALGNACVKGALTKEEKTSEGEYQGS